MFFNSDNTPMIPRSLKPDDEGINIDKLIGGLQKGNLDVVSAPTKVEEYNEADVKELEDFCRTHGILGVGLGNANPKAMLRMLKAKMGIVETPKSEKGLIQG